MRLTTRERLLIALGEQPEAYSSVWDVPREASLPGLSERLGVVRSALHDPLKDLAEDGLVEVRQAHVIGGGTRKRSVIHLTESGRIESEYLRESIEESGDSEDTKVGGRLIGGAPSPVSIHGREEVIEKLLLGVESRDSQVVTGLPGIGKTALVREVVERAVETGWNVRWSTLDADGDIALVASDWFESDGMSTHDAIIARIGSVPARTLLVIDEIQAVHARHAGSVTALCETLLGLSRPVILSTRAPPPFDVEGSGATECRLEGLSDDSGAMILGGAIDSEQAAAVSAALGGHPLALHLWTPEDSVPAASTAVQDFVQETVLARLDDEANAALEELTISPTALGVEEVRSSDGIANLDDGAILRWLSSSAEVQHLIRNVRLASWPDGERASLHSILAIWWSEIEGARARRMEAHHSLRSGDADQEGLARLIAAFCKDSSAAAAALLEDSLEAMPEAHDLRRLATDVALERGEAGYAAEHLDALPDDAAKHTRLARLARMRGDVTAASSHEEAAAALATPEEKVRQEISDIIRTIDDRLPGEELDDKAKHLLKRIDRCDVSFLEGERLRAAEVALATSRLRIQMGIGREEKATEALEHLSSLTSSGDPTIRRLRLRIDIASARDDGELAYLTARIDAEQDARARCGAVHALLESVGGAPAARACFERHVHAALRDDVAADRRLLAQRWYWRGVLSEAERIASWHEACERYKRAECAHAAASLLARIHELL